MIRRNKVELFAQLRHEYEFGVGTVAGVARKFGVHRRLVRQALKNALPPPRKAAPRASSLPQEVMTFMQQVLQADQQAPRKQRHTAHRLFVRLKERFQELAPAERTVRHYVRQWKQAQGLLGTEVKVPQHYECGVEAQVDWYEAVVEIAGERQTIQVLAVRSMFSGAAYHRAYLRATQQAFLEAQQMAFHYFGGVFRRLRYDNLKSAVQRILRGSRREETARFLAFRSHWQFEASFCNPAAGHEKGGVEGEVGYFRRNHLVPLPQVQSLAALNEFLTQEAQADFARQLAGRHTTVGAAFAQEQATLRQLPEEDFVLAEEHFCRVDTKGCVQVRTNWYSTPCAPGQQVRVRVLPTQIEIWQQGQCCATHPRCYSRRQQCLDLEHYLDVLQRKPGALAGSKPLQQWRQAGRWTPSYDQFWAALQQRHGVQAGTRLMIEVVQLGRTHGYAQLTQALEQALRLGAQDVAAVRYLLTSARTTGPSPLQLPPEAVKRREYYERPLPILSAYDELLHHAPASPQEITL